MHNFTKTAKTFVNYLIILQLGKMTIFDKSIQYAQSF